MTDRSRYTSKMTFKIFLTFAGYKQDFLLNGSAVELVEDAKIKKWSSAKLFL